MSVGFVSGMKVMLVVLSVEQVDDGVGGGVFVDEWLGGNDSGELELVDNSVGDLTKEKGTKVGVTLLVDRATFAGMKKKLVDVVGKVFE